MKDKKQSRCVNNGCPRKEEEEEDEKKGAEVSIH